MVDNDVFGSCVGLGGSFYLLARAAGHGNCTDAVALEARAFVEARACFLKWGDLNACLYLNKN